MHGQKAQNQHQCFVVVFLSVRLSLAISHEEAKCEYKKKKYNTVSFALFEKAGEWKRKNGKWRKRKIGFISSMPCKCDQQSSQWFVLNIVNPNNGILFAFSLFSAFSGCLSLIGPICTTKIRAFGTHFHGESLAYKNSHIINWLNKKKIQSKIHPTLLNWYLAFFFLSCYSFSPLQL